MTDTLFDLTGRCAVVTGGASGIAQAIAIGFACHGAAVIVADINDVGVADTCAQIEAQGIPMNRLGEPADMVGSAIFLASPASAFVTGVLLPVDGGNLAMNADGSHVW